MKKIKAWLASEWVRMKHSLAFKFTLFSLLAVILPAVTIAASLMVIGRRALTDSIYAEQSEAVRRIVDRITVHINSVRSVIAIASEEPGLAVFSRARKEESLRRLLRWQTTFKEAFVLNQSGIEVAKLTSKNKRFVSNKRLLTRRNRPEFRVPMQEGGTIIGDPFFSGDRLPYLFVASPTYGRKAVLVAKVSLANLWDLVKEARQDQPGIAYIVEKNGYLMAHPDSLRVQMHTNLDNLSIIQSFKEGKLGRDSFGLHRNERGEKVVSIVQEVPELGWGVVVQIPTSSAYAPIRMMQKEVIKWTFISVLMILAVAFWRVRQIVKPVKLLEDGVRKISQGKLDFNLDVKTGDELEHLAESFKKMAEALRQLEELRRDLISMIVHDLKSPLSAIMGGIDYLTECDSGHMSDSSKKILSLSRKSSEDMLQMIQNLLDIAKMEEGKLILSAQPVALYDLLDETSDHFRIQVKKESKHFNRNYEKSLPEVHMDVHLIRRVLSNLVSNAIRHTSSGGHISLCAQELDDFVQIIIQDDGEGIPLDYQKKIFDKFVQAERKRVHLRTGTGLGLTFCKMAIELHGGEISVESRVGEGSSFKFTLPCTQKTRIKTVQNAELTLQS